MAGPGCLPRYPDAARSTRGAVVLDRIDHVGIACHDLAAKIALYESVFDLTVVSHEVNEEQGVREAMLRAAAAPGGSSRVQLLSPPRADSPGGPLPARRGVGGSHHRFGGA